MANPLAELPQPLILGSGSFTRKLILREMGVDFVVVTRSIDERSLGDRERDAPEELVTQLAHAKMDHLLKEIQAGNCADDLPDRSGPKPGERLVMTADQVVTCNGKILEKPDDVEQAKRFVQEYGRSPCSTVGAVVFAHVPSQTRVSALHKATIHFRSTLTGEAANQLVDDLIEDEAPVLSCAGGLMIEHPLTKNYVERIDGSEDSVMGLCKLTVLDLLASMRTKLNSAS